jgi:hypothetical protein
MEREAFFNQSMTEVVVDIPDGTEAKITMGTAIVVLIVILGCCCACIVGVCSLQRRNKRLIEKEAKESAEALRKATYMSHQIDVANQENEDAKGEKQNGSDAKHNTSSKFLGKDG